MIYTMSNMSFRKDIHKLGAKRALAKRATNARSTTSISRDERGLVSFMVTLIMMLVISLIVIGFTQSANRNRRQTLDRQLSAQAFYAAESGVNDAVKHIRSLVDSGAAVPSQDTCTGTDYSSSANLKPDGSVKYTCVLVKTTVPDIRTTASMQASSVAHLNLSAEDGGPFVPVTASIALSFTWDAETAVVSAAPSDCNTTGTFVASASNTCGYGLLRVDLMQMPASGFINAAASDLADQTVSLYMQPVSGGPTGVTINDFTGSSKAYIVPAACDQAQRHCVGTVTLTGPAKAQLNYYARISTLYRNTPSVVIDAKNALSDDAWFSDSQARIDVTGKAQDILRRIQVRVPLQRTGVTDLPLGPVQSAGDVCKRFSVYPGGYTGCPTP